MGSNTVNRIFMDRLTIEHGIECSDCLYWFVPFFDKSEPCPHCKKQGVPEFPNRVRYLAVQHDISLRQVARDANIAWRTLRLIYTGRSSPYLTTKKKILKALGESSKKNNIHYIFPKSRY